METNGVCRVCLLAQTYIYILGSHTKNFNNFDNINIHKVICCYFYLHTSTDNKSIPLSSITLLSTVRLKLSELFFVTVNRKIYPGERKCCMFCGMNKDTHIKTDFTMDFPLTAKYRDSCHAKSKRFF